MYILVHEFIILLHICNLAHYREEISTEIAKIFHSGFCLFVLVNQQFSLAIFKMNWALVQLCPGQRQIKNSMLQSHIHPPMTNIREQIC